MNHQSLLMFRFVEFLMESQRERENVLPWSIPSSYSMQCIGRHVPSTMMIIYYLLYYIYYILYIIYFIYISWKHTFLKCFFSTSPLIGPFGHRDVGVEMDQSASTMRHCGLPQRRRYKEVRSRSDFCCLSKKKLLNNHLFSTICCCPCAQQTDTTQSKKLYTLKLRWKT